MHFSVAHYSNIHSIYIFLIHNVGIIKVDNCSVEVKMAGIFFYYIAKWCHQNLIKSYEVE